MYPVEVQGFDKVELKLGIKSSLPKLRPLLSLVYTLWKVTGEKSSIKYSETNNKEIKLRQELKESISNYFSNELSEVSIEKNDFFKTLDFNNLIKSQIEPLQVGLSLVWKICKLEFEDSSLSYSSEREGGRRFKKIIEYTKVIDQIDLLISLEEVGFKRILFKWLTDSEIDIDTNLEQKLIKAFTLHSEEAVYRIQFNKNEDMKFLQSGIYERIEDLSTKIQIGTDMEAKGSLRILGSILKDNLNFYLQKENSKFVTLKEGIDPNALKEYSKRVNNYLPLTNITIELAKIEDEISPDSIIENIDINKSHNRILYGAPGTGKSYHLKQDATLFEENYERVTFHPNYTYSQFVGAYKPVPLYKEHLDSSRFSKVIPNINDDDQVSKSEDRYKKMYPIVNETTITYEYVAGPLLKTLVNALKNPNLNYLLIIEEINRAQVSAVFGDIFQLLDRDASGESEYRVSVSNEMRSFFRSEGIEENLESIYLPKNLYIWATMNSADQGVFPLDTAFKRRWDFEYIHLNKGDKKINIEVSIGYLGYLNWNNFRKALNEFLSNLGVREDKLIGPFFINVRTLENETTFENALKNKLFMYLYEDINKYTSSKIFADNIDKFSDLLDRYENKLPIFDSLFDEIFNRILEEEPIGE